MSELEVIQQEIQVEQARKGEQTSLWRYVWDCSIPEYPCMDGICQVKGICELPCPRCSGLKGQWRGYRQLASNDVVHRRWCTKCGRWFGRKVR